MEDLDIKDKILKGSQELFMKYGVRSISMDDIARHLSVSKKTLYQHFTDKEEIVTQVSQTHLDRITNQMDGLREEAENAIDELAKISVCIKQNMEDMNPSLLFDLQKYHPKAWSVWMEHKNKYIYESVVRNLKQGIEDGHFRAEIKTEIIATTRLLMIEVVFDERIFPKDKFNLMEMQSEIFDHFVYGICTEKGRKLYQKYKENQHSESIPK
ncbi:MAG: TetR/AcrR family transcriptional regulator [Bacteroidia bacterium]|nr:TetR/AcrR family transcriptional regulator [Bacteroidia bacterium]